MSTTGWEQALERLAQHLAEQRRAVESGDLRALDPFVPEAGLGPLPVELHDRARRLHAECEALVAQLTAARDRTAQDLAALLRPQSDAAPSYVDSRA